MDIRAFFAKPKATASDAAKAQTDKAAKGDTKALTSGSKRKAVDKTPQTGSADSGSGKKRPATSTQPEAVGAAETAPTPAKRVISPDEFFSLACSTKTPARSSSSPSTAQAPAAAGGASHTGKRKLKPEEDEEPPAKAPTPTPTPTPKPTPSSGGGSGAKAKKQSAAGTPASTGKASTHDEGPTGPSTCDAGPPQRASPATGASAAPAGSPSATAIVKSPAKESVAKPGSESADAGSASKPAKRALPSAFSKSKASPASDKKGKPDPPAASSKKEKAADPPASEKKAKADPPVAPAGKAKSPSSAPESSDKLASAPAAASKVKPSAAKAAPKAATTASDPPPPPPRKWYPGMRDTAPPNKGCKRIPVGTEDCLAGKTFVVTGAQDSLEREEMDALIVKHGGKVTGSVSGKTSYLVQGIDNATGEKMEGSKFTKARQLNTPIIDEDALLDLIRASAPQPEEPPSEVEEEKDEDGEADMTAADADAGASSGGALSHPAEGSKTSASQRTDEQHAPPLWAEKYRPTDVQHLVGNGDHVKRLVHWLQNWQSIARACESEGKASKTNFKAALLSGPPGVGKTSAARVALVSCGYDVVELNASDTRSEKALQACATDMLGNTSIADFAHADGNRPGTGGRMALVMDEVDGMSAGDRGGVQLLIKLIQRSKMPVICICNDRQSPKIKSLANHCLDLRFRRPGSKEVAVALRRVAKSEGYTIGTETLEKVAEACNADIRQMLNLLQMWRPNSSTLSSSDVSKSMAGCFKDVDVGPFDVAHKFFRDVNTPVDTRLRHYFVDSSMTPLLVQDSYLSVNLNLPQLPPARQQFLVLQRMASAAEAIAEADIVGVRISRDQSWSLAPLHGILSCVKPGSHMAGNVGRLNFPSWLGRNSTQTKRLRLLRECGAHMQAHISGSSHEVRQSYFPALREPLLRPLREEGVAGVDKVLSVMDGYSLSKDDFDTIMEMQLLAAGGTADIAQIPTNVKSALTRKYNQTHLAVHKARSAPAAGRASLRFDEDGIAEEDGEEEGEVEAEEDADQLVKPKAKGKDPKPAKGKAKQK